MESIAQAAARITPRRMAGAINSPQHYGVKQWATVLTSIPRTHNIPWQQLPRAHYATGTKHEKAIGKLRWGPRITYQPTTASTWIISDGSVSADKEAINLAKGLSLPWQIKRVQWRQADKLPWFLTGDSLAGPFPSHVIGAGPNAIPGILQVSRMSGKASFSSYIHFPTLPFVHFDQVFLQRHEVVVQLAALGMMKDQKNYFMTKSTLNSITRKSLQLAKTKALENHLIPKAFFQDNKTNKYIPTTVTVLMGGPNEDCSHNTARMIDRLSRLIDVQDCRVLVTFSQRTPANTKQAIAKWQEQVQDEERLFVFDPMAQLATKDSKDTQKQISWANTPGPKGVLGFTSDRNPYEAMLALADKIVVTADSIAMTNEALATGKPVYILGGELARGKLKVFHRYLTDLSLTRAFRPGRIPVLPTHSSTTTTTSFSSSSTARSPAAIRTDPIEVHDTADPLSYPGDHPPWKRTLEGQGPDENKRLAERLTILRDYRLAGKRIPPHIADATR
ncbi:hypothetical protein FBU30_008762 [Linnemannia zychae]|nr:hypothetical protein FBU30_008762 [Linnemannia zychae]